jgi:hypothetical protein
MSSKKGSSASFDILLFLFTCSTNNFSHYHFLNGWMPLIHKPELTQRRTIGASRINIASLFPDDQDIWLLNLPQL